MEIKILFYLGGGYALYWYLKFFHQYGITPKYIVDNNKTKHGSRMYGIPVVSLEEALSNSKDYNIVITAPKFLDEIKETLLTKCPIERIFSFEAEIYYNFIHDISVYKEYLLSNWERVVKLYMNLEDDLSRITLEAFLKGRVSAEQHYFIDVKVPDQYYPKDIIHFGETETMVELGANDGKTLLEFLEVVDRKYNEIYCFEPDKDCINKLQKVISQEEGKINIIERGAWDKPTMLSFQSDAEFGASRIAENDIVMEYSILVDTVDNCVNAPVTYMKMDIEGAELKALRGSKRTILMYKPQLAICVYHNQEDLLDIVDYLREIVPDYKFFLRHHNWGATETVLYAVTR